jgi:hypothetical protein
MHHQFKVCECQGLWLSSSGLVCWIPFFFFFPLWFTVRGRVWGVSCLWLVICWFVCIVDLAHEKDDLRKAISVSIKTLYIGLAIFAERCIQSETTENTCSTCCYRVKTSRISNESSRVFVVDYIVLLRQRS